MKPFVLLFMYLADAAVWAQTKPPEPAPPPESNPDAVIAVLDDGKQVTYGEMRIYMGTLPPQVQQAALRDRKTFVTQYALLRKLAKMAEENKLGEKTPTREMLEFNRLQMLASAQINEAAEQVKVPSAEVEQFYKANRDRYTQVVVKALYVSFSPSSASAGDKKYATEPEARQKIEKLLKEIRGGSDFVKMVKEHSEDPTSAAKDGDFGNIRRGDNLPDAVRNAIFALKEGEVSEPVRQPNGFYLFRADKITPQPLEQVRDEIFNELKQTRFRQWMDETQRSIQVKFVETPAPPATPAPAPALVRPAVK